MGIAFYTKKSILVRIQLGIVCLNVLRIQWLVGYMASPSILLGHPHAMLWRSQYKRIANTRELHTQPHKRHIQGFQTQDLQLVALPTSKPRKAMARIPSPTVLVLVCMSWLWRSLPHDPHDQYARLDGVGYA